MDTKNFNYTISELQRIEGLSVRACNVCERQGLIDLESILEYYKEHGSFINLQNSGRRTDMELQLLCQIYGEEHESKNIKLPACFPPMKTLSEYQQLVLNSSAQNKLTSLSQRGQNLLSGLFHGAITFDSIYRNFIEGRANIEVDLPKSGEKTNLELASYINDQYEFYLKVSELSDESLRLIALKEWVSLHFNLSECDFTPYEILTLDSKFPLFGFVNFLFRNEKILSKKSAFIFEKRSGYFENGNVESLENIAKDLKLTRERVRQIAEKSNASFDKGLYKFSQHWKLLRNITCYSWNYNNDILFTSKAYSEILNQIEAINFQPSLFTRILLLLVGETHSLLEGNSKYQRPDYLIKKDIFEVFNFQNFIEDILKQLEFEISSDYSLSFDGYLLSFAKENCSLPHLYRISEVCRTILLHEFPDKISFIFEGDLTFHRNTSIKVEDLAKEVLNAENAPMNIWEIYERIKTRNPEYSGGIESLRSSLIKKKEIFIYFGRKSSYGLKEWEDKIDGIKGGTIRTIVEEYLEEFNEPKHISEILDFVLKFRPTTNERAIASNLELEQSSKFKDFGCGFWGLSEKEYKNCDLEFKSVTPAFNRYVTTLLKKEGAMPFYKLVEHFCQSLQLRAVQVDYQVRKLIKEEKLTLSEDGMLSFFQD